MNYLFNQATFHRSRLFTFVRFLRKFNFELRLGVGIAVEVHRVEVGPRRGGGLLRPLIGASCAGGKNPKKFMCWLVFGESFNEASEKRASSARHTNYVTR